MKVQSELMRQGLFVEWQTVLVTAESQQSPKQIAHVPTERSPTHLDVAVQNQLDSRGRRRLCKRPAERPSTQDIPMLHASSTLQRDELIARLLGQANMFQRHDASQKYPSTTLVAFVAASNSR